jgi:hypothetical protein
MNQLKKSPARSRFNLLREVCNLIPQLTVARLARATGAEDKSRTFTPWSHVVSHCYGQLAHSISLNDVYDALQLQSGSLVSISAATRPSRNGFSNANRERPAEMAEQTFWAVLGHLGKSLRDMWMDGTMARPFGSRCPAEGAFDTHRRGNT